MCKDLLLNAYGQDSVSSFIKPKHRQTHDAITVISTCQLNRNCTIKHTLHCIVFECTSDKQHHTQPID